MTADDVALGGDEVTRSESGDAVTDRLDLAGKFVPDHEGRVDAALRPSVPVGDMEIGAAHARVAHGDEDLAGSWDRLGDVLHGQAGRAFFLDDRLHGLSEWERPDSGFSRAPLGLDPDGADLQLRHLRVGIEHRIGEEVGRRFTKMKWHEHLAARDAFRDARGADHGVAARRKPHQIAFADTDGFGIRGMNLHDGCGLAGIEAARAPSHRTGVPAVELSTRVHDEGLIIVGQLHRIGVLDRHKGGAAVRRRERVVE